MKKMMQTSLAAIFAIALGTATASLHAQTDSAAKKPAPTAPAKPAAKPATKAAPVASKPVADTVFAYPAAIGTMPCEDNVTVTISKDAKRADGFDVQLGKSHFPTTRVATDSGAIRLENKTSGIVWLQMANKSMLFNEKAGKRLANNCRNDAQVAAENAMSTSTAPTVLDTPVTKKP